MLPAADASRHLLMTPDNCRLLVWPADTPRHLPTPSDACQTLVTPVDTFPWCCCHRCLSKSFLRCYCLIKGAPCDQRVICTCLQHHLQMRQAGWFVMSVKFFSSLNMCQMWWVLKHVKWVKCVLEEVLFIKCASKFCRFCTVIFLWNAAECKL